MKNFTKWWKSFSFQLLGGLHQLSSLRYWWAIFISSWQPCHSQWCSCWTHPATPACRPGRPSPRGGRILKKGNTGQFIVEIALYHFQSSFVLEFQIWSVHLSTVTFMFTKIGQYWSQKKLLRCFKAKVLMGGDILECPLQLFSGAGVHSFWTKLQTLMFQQIFGDKA